jgi:molecular chaperone GrpE
MTDKMNPNEIESDLIDKASKDEETPVSENTDQSGETSDQDHKSKSHKKHKKDKTSDIIQELGEKLAELNDRHLRLQAEFDNFRKRTLKEKAELIKSGGESVLTAILPIIDDFERALGTMTAVPEDDPTKIGFMLIFSKFRDFLKVNQVMEIEATGKDFDVDMHDAITIIPAPSEDMKGKVVDVIQKGYMLNGRVIRYAKVIIGD